MVADTEPKATKRIRIRKCGAHLRIPAEPAIAGGKTHAEVIFTCQLEKDHAEPHQEIGSVQMDNATARDYCIEWEDVGVRALRQRSKQ